MGAPPAANQPLQDRVLQLAQTLQFAWFVGHVTLLLCTFRYGLSYVFFNYYSKWAQFSYRTAFISAAVTYGIVVFKSNRAKLRTGAKPAPTAIQLIGDENVQYLLMALVWLYSRQVPLALLPFSVYSIFHVATYTRANLIPTFQPPPPSATAGGASPGKAASKSSPLADSIGRFVKQYYDASMSLVAGLEIALWFRVLLSAFTFSKGGMLLLVIYTAFFRSRYSQSAFVQGAIRQFGAHVDGLVANQSTPPVARQGWETVKGVVAQVTDATDLRKYMGNAQAKKPQ